MFNNEKCVREREETRGRKSRHFTLITNTTPKTKVYDCPSVIKKRRFLEVPDPREWELSDYLLFEERYSSKHYLLCYPRMTSLNFLYMFHLTERLTSSRLSLETRSNTDEFNLT